MGMVTQHYQAQLLSALTGMDRHVTGLWEICVTGTSPRNVKLVHEGGIRLTQQFNAWN